MNIGGGEAADQLVRMMLSFGEVSVRLSGSALKNVLALSLALAKNNKTISGKINLGKMLRETRDLRQFPMSPEQYKEFSKLAKKQKILFSAIHDKDEKGKLIDVILPVTELDRANMIFERVGYLAPEPAALQREQQPPREGREGPQKQREEKSKTRGPPGAGGPPEGPQRAGAGPGQEPSGGGRVKKRFSVATRLARYQKQLLFTQKSRSFDEDE